MSDSKKSDAKKGTSGFPIVGVGASAGGLAAAEKFLDNMPEDAGMAIVLVFHLDPKHKSELAGILQNHTSMPVSQVTRRTAIQPNHVYVIAPNHGLSLKDGELTLTKLERADGRPTVIDRFFRSLAEYAGERSIGVVLSGTGTEGSQGLRSIKEMGGLTVVQAEGDAEYPGMPHSAIATGIIDFVLPVADIPARLVKVKDFAVDFELPEAHLVPGENDAETLQKIYVQLRSQIGHDFSEYKQSTILRRIARRMQVHQLTEFSGYLELLRKTPAEADALFRELLISVTNFFRDPDAMAVLEHEIVPKLCRAVEGQSSVRVWVPGCATGEEAYSLAIMLREACDGFATPPRLQIFATDVDERALEVARRGVYPDAIAGDVSEARLKHFFHRDGDRYVVSQSLREMILFTRHDLLQDPPFSRLNLISCRNVLIYLKTEIQSRVFSLFHFALKQQGFLFLGGSESLGGAGKLFSEIDRKAKLFQARRVPMAEVRFPLLPSAGRSEITRPERAEPRKRFEDIAHDELLTRYAPPCVVVGEDYDVAYISGRVGKYLEPGVGEANYNILTMARESLRMELRAGLYQVFHNGEGVHRKPVRLSGSGELIGLTVHPLVEADGYAMVVFEPLDAAEVVAQPPRDGVDENMIAQLEDELVSTRESLQTSIEELETSNEELRASNEEMQSVNEELQSTSEELETGREELQSANEELLAINQELRVKNDELMRSNSDLNNFISSTEIGTMFLDRELQVRRYTPRMTELFNLIPGDVGRPFSHVTHNLSGADLLGDAERVLHDLVMIERESISKDGRYFQTRLRPYRTVDNRVDGVVITFVDVTERHQREERTKGSNVQLESQVAYVESVIASVQTPMLVLDADLRVVSASPAFHHAFGTSRELVDKMPLYEIGNRRWDIPMLRRMLGEVLHQRVSFDDYEVRYDAGAGERILLLNAHRLVQGRGQPPMALLSLDDITERARTSEVLAASERKYRDLFESMDEGFCLVEMLFDETDKAVDYRFAEVNPAFERHAGLANVVGKTIKQLVPAYEKHWLERFGKVAATGKSVRFEEGVAGLGRWFNVFAFRAEALPAPRVAILFTDITQRKREERSLVRLANIVASSDDAIISKDLDGVITTWNNAAERMFGYSREEAIDKSIIKLIVPSDRVHEEEEILATLKRGENIDHFETVRQTKSGDRVDVSVTISPLLENGRVIGACKIARDIGESKRITEHQKLLIHELNHRVKNTLTAVQAMAMQTFHDPAMIAQRELFEGRLMALSAAQDVLTRERWKGAGIHEVVHNAVAAWVDGGSLRISIEGPYMRLRPAAALSLAMALHELGTNATKYGALSNGSGKVAVEWSVSETDPVRFRMRWQESDGPPCREPTRHGFGFRLVKYALAQDFRGSVDLQFKANGVIWSVDAPLDEINEEFEAVLA